MCFFHAADIIYTRVRIGFQVSRLVQVFFLINMF